MMQAVLTVNVGSSSIKAALFDVRTGMNLDRLSLKTHTTPEALAQVAAWVENQNKGEVKEITAVVNRIVHGGAHYTQTTPLNAKILNALEAFEAYAPLHQPFGLMAARFMQQAFPTAQHFACFDTAFHATNEPLFTTLAIPNHFGLRRFGFHGLSYQNVAQQVPQGRVVAAHLGAGASVCAMLNGKSVATSMGLTALDGLPMGTRCGALDAGAVLVLATQLGVAETQRVLYQESGLKALCGVADWQQLRLSQTPQSNFAVAYFIERVAESVAALATSLGGLDTLVFTGGIGENDADLQQAVTAKLAFLGGFETQVVKCDEERVLFNQTLATLR